MPITIDPHAWERGCKEDPARNSFVVPAIARLIERIRPKQVLDIGCGTGYVVRNVAMQAQHTPNYWILLDKNPAMIAYARSVTSSWTSTVCLCQGVDEPLPETLSGSPDFAFSTYAMLEIEDIDAFARGICRLLAPNAWLAIIGPDTLEDVIGQSDTLKLVQSYRAGQARISKINSFTGTELTFVAHRMFFQISVFIKSGFALMDIEMAELPNGKTHALMLFQKCEPTHVTPTT